MSTTIVTATDLAQEYLNPLIYELMEKWDTTPIYQTLSYGSAPIGVNKVSIPVSELMDDSRSYTVGSGAALTADSHEVTIVEMLLDQVKYKLINIEDWVQIETNVQLRETLARQIVKVMTRALNVGAITVLKSTADLVAADDSYESPATSLSSLVDYTDKSAVVTEVERLIAAMDADLADDGLEDSPRYTLMGTDIAGFMKRYGTGQNQARTDLIPSFVTGTLNPILGTIPLPWQKSGLGYSYVADYGDDGYTVIPIVEYMPECALFGVQVQPSLEVFKESDFFGSKLRASEKFGYKTLDTRKMRVGFLKVSGDPLSLA